MSGARGEAAAAPSGAPRASAAGPGLRPEVIEVNLSDLHQLFNSLDPSPFHERDLDDDAERFIVGWVLDFPTERPRSLRVHVARPPHLSAAELATAVGHYFAERARQARRELRELLRRGRKSLAIGIVFLAACAIGAELAGRTEGVFFARVVQEGLTVAGWVAMWRPIQIFLYEWWPIRDEQRLYEGLSRMEVSLIVDGAALARGDGGGGGAAEGAPAAAPASPAPAAPAAGAPIAGAARP